MTVFDQFQTEPTVAYTGSYGSRIFFEKSTIYTTGSFARQVIGDSATKWFSTGSLVGKKYIMSDYPTIYTVRNNNYITRQGFVRFGVAVDQREQYYDSVVGHPISYITVNGVSQSVVITQGFSFVDSDAHRMLGFPAIAPTSSIYLFVGTSATTISMGDGAQERFCDNTWNYTGPFQSRYKNVFRLQQPTYRTPAAGKSVVSSTLLGGTTLRRNAANFTASYDSVSVLAYTTRSAAPGEIPNQLTLMFDVPFSGAAGNLTASFLNATNFLNPLMTTNMLYRGFFGFGDGTHNFPQGFYNEHVSAGGSAYVFSSVPLIRGWKYGLYDAQPRYSTALWRYDRFGQMRDMLEQRPYSKFYSDGEPLEAAVQVRFLTSSVAYSRSLDYVSATNPSYDPRDTGFYDYEYRCGAPFQDIEPVD